MKNCRQREVTKNKLIAFGVSFFLSQTLSMFSFSGSLYTHSVEKRPRRLKIEIKIELHSKYNIL